MTMIQASNKMLEYKGYYGSIAYDQESQMLYGKLLGIKGAYVYEGRTLEELRADFRQFVEDYLYDCQQDDVAPQKPNLRSFHVGIGAEQHVKASGKAIAHESERQFA